MKQVADYKFTLNYKGKDYSFTDKIKMDYYNSGGYIAMHIKNNPFRDVLANRIPEILILGSKGYHSYTFYEVNDKSTYWEYMKNQYIFHMIKNLNDLCDVKNVILFNLTSNNYRNMFSCRWNMKNLSDWADDINKQKVAIYEKDDDINISKCGYAKINVNLNKAKIYGMLI